MKSLNREILRLSIPSILANITVPLVGMVDIAVAGHLTSASGSAVFIAGISIGSLIFNLLYWNFFFIRAGIGGLTAQAFGREDMADCARMLGRGIGVAMGFAVIILLLQKPFSSLALLLVDGSPEARDLAVQYFFIRVWAAPATVSLMALRGWFVGMQDSLSSMFTDLVVNVLNIAASIILSFGIGSWEGLGFAGIAWGTVLAQYGGLLFAAAVVLFKYGKVFRGFRLRECFRREEMSSFMSMNADLMIRSLSFTGIYMGFTIIAASFGDVLLACSTIMMNLLMVFSYFTDGFAYAGEALTGRFIGARDRVMGRRTVRNVFLWSMGVALAWVAIYATAGGLVLSLMTSDPVVARQCREFLPWLILMPPLGCAAFTWDGIYLGATASRGIRDAMLGALVSFFGLWFAFKGLARFNPLGLFNFSLQGENPLGIHLLLAAYFAHLAFRTVWLTIRYPRDILSRFPAE